MKNIDRWEVLSGKASLEKILELNEQCGMELVIEDGEIVEITEEL